MKTRFYSMIGLATIALMAMMLSACTMVFGSGHVVTEDRSVSNFNRVELAGSGELIITQGEEESLQIEAEDNLMRYIEAEVIHGTLHIGFKNYPSVVIQTNKPLRFYLSVKDLEAVTISGSGDLYAESLSGNDIDFQVSGSGDILIDDLQAQTLKVTISGSGDCELTGKVDDQTVTISGAGNYKASKLETQTTKVTINGSGSVTVWAIDDLDVSIAGSGDVGYYGNPHVSQHIAGSGDVNSRERR